MKELTPIYSNAHAKCQKDASALFWSYHHHTNSTLMPHALLATTKPAAEPARCLCRLVLDDGIKLVRCCVNLLAGLV